MRKPSLLKTLHRYEANKEDKFQNIFIILTGEILKFSETALLGMCTQQVCKFIYKLKRLTTKRQIIDRATVGEHTAVFIFPFYKTI